MEQDFIRWLRTTLPQHPSVPVPIGDDAAQLQLAGGDRCVISTDLLTDGVDFIFDSESPERIGRKALAVNLSDMAAMAATPFAVLVSLVAPHNSGIETLQNLYAGIIDLAREFDVPIVGGDTNSWDGPLAISITILGQNDERGPWLRRGAIPGDAIVVTGEFGGSILSKHFDFTPRVNEALSIKQSFNVHAATDVSDGLARDLSHIASESRCGALLHLDSIPIATDAKTLSETEQNKAEQNKVEQNKAEQDSQTPLQHALYDGEDFELILAMPQAEADRLSQQPLPNCPLTIVGQFVTGSGLWSSQPNGRKTPLEIRGFEHQL